MKKKIAVYCRVSSLDQARFGFSLNDQERRIRAYLNAMEEPECFSIEAIYKKSLDSKIKNVISCLRKQKSQGKLKKIIIQGKDDQGFEKIFNEGTFVNKINIDYSSDGDDAGMIDEELIKNSLLRKLEINV